MQMFAQEGRYSYIRAAVLLQRRRQQWQLQPERRAVTGNRVETDRAAHPLD